ncbi:energy-coupling factor transporter transmembrane protein EcfT [Limosilactobacillus sp. STM2_1]|uniref:Energy-coupling factor transporter transmembrane protein EcfT n=1 Tax=Limosilactobacillus rudii TaxID=2759755 RepID=A0A7W3ULI5_9LACO|nr:energy-coupling factor transporter transmembrane component T [Limosilactobacillus rudii]MBB1079727.1 energy-coupling factor transporter transmembrane protein EcfT [Limosilactobacillus rudii]MBB1097813.1 energy-coupling factor transporter transmembrane protein EcfT [Limosilactobacillus rudii]MCD7134894.1 energy-coupling factor transporter transmembrane protein EcfT [Limosilactobacillus rudii]
MTNKIVFGSYVPVKSILHRLDPRIKLIMCIAFVILIFFVNSWLTGLWLFLALLLAIKLSNVAVKQYWQGIKPLFLIILITVAFQILFSSGGKTYWHWGIMAITYDGLINSLIIFYRFIVIITASTVLTATTPTFQIADALAWIMKPLKIIKVPVNQITLMLSIALRFVPTIMDETSKIMKAQRARGMNFNDGNILTRIKHLVPILIPLFVNSFKRAEELATAMEARGYDPNAVRTHYRQLTWHSRDAWAGLGLIIVVIGLFSIRIFF